MLPENAYDVVDGFDGDGESYEDKTYRIVAETEEIKGFFDKKDAVRQAVMKILNTERFRYPVYSSDYGIELHDLYGEDSDYTCVELERRITEALIADERIIGVVDFNFSVNKNKVHVSFVVNTVYGDFETEKEVAV